MRERVAARRGELVAHGISRDRSRVYFRASGRVFRAPPVTASSWNERASFRAQRTAWKLPESAKRRCSVTLGRAPHATRRAVAHMAPATSDANENKWAELNKAREQSMYTFLFPLLYAPARCPHTNSAAKSPCCATGLQGGQAYSRTRGTSWGKIAAYNTARSSSA